MVSVDVFCFFVLATNQSKYCSSMHKIPKRKKYFKPFLLPAFILESSAELDVDAFNFSDLKASFDSFDLFAILFCKKTISQMDSPSIC